MLTSAARIVAAGLFTAMLWIDVAAAAELIMMTRKGCPWCEKFEAEIGDIYAMTEEGKTLPLRRVDADKKMPPDLRAVAGDRLTPTFILVDKGREVSRLRGYSGPHFFFGQLREMMALLPQRTAPAR